MTICLAFIIFKAARKVTAKYNSISEGNYIYFIILPLNVINNETPRMASIKGPLSYFRTYTIEWRELKLILYKN